MGSESEYPSKMVILRPLQIFSNGVLMTRRSPLFFNFVIICTEFWINFVNFSSNWKESPNIVAFVIWECKCFLFRSCLDVLIFSMLRKYICFSICRKICLGKSLSSYPSGWNVWVSVSSYPSLGYRSAFNSRMS